MTTEIDNFKKKMDNLKQEIQNKKAKEPQCSGKICPFMSTPNGDRECTPQCKLYRAGNKNFECTFFAIQTISWYAKNGTGQNGRY